MFSRKLFLLSLGLASIAIVWSGVILFTERTRAMEGTWVDLAEGSSFFEGQTLAQACGPSFDKASWFNYFPSEQTPEGEMVAKHRNSGLFISKEGAWRVGAYSIKFIGHRNVSEAFGLMWILGAYGPMGGFGSEIEVDRVIAIKPIPDVICDVRQP